MKKQMVLGGMAMLLAVAASVPARAQSGFYGGVSIRDGAAASSGLVLGNQPLAWSRFSAPIGEETNQRSQVFGGYRWSNDVAVEATLNTTTTDDGYALRPSPTGVASAQGLGLSLGDGVSRSWNADVYTSWEMIHRLSLYGRLGYAQSELRPLFSPALVQDDPRHREGVNYGVGLHYDVTHSLGLRVEYARFGRFAGETPLSGSMPESDQVTIGVQYRF